MKKLATIFCLIVWSSLVQAQIGTKARQPQITGSWLNAEYGYDMMLTLNSGGTGAFDGSAITYTTQADQLVIIAQGVTTRYTYHLNGTELTISGGDLDKPILFIRKGEPTSEYVSANHVATSASGNAIPKELIGTWSGNNESFEFRQNAQCAYQGQLFEYSVSNNILSIKGAQGDLSMPFKITGSTLNLTINGQHYTFTKGSTQPSTNPSVAAGTKNLDQTLVGKWCYINVYSSSGGSSSASECVIIKADGTYIYHSESSRSVDAGSTYSQDNDTGSWWVENDRLIYHSQTQGQGSYKLEKRNHPKNTNDPMIILDGRTFVTATNRAPW